MPEDDENGEGEEGEAAIDDQPTAADEEAFDRNVDQARGGGCCSDGGGGGVCSDVCVAAGLWGSVALHGCGVWVSLVRWGVAVQAGACGGLALGCGSVCFTYKSLLL